MKKYGIKMLCKDGFKKEKLAFVVLFGTPSIPAA